MAAVTAEIFRHDLSYGSYGTVGYYSAAYSWERVGKNVVYHLIFQYHRDPGWSDDAFPAQQEISGAIHGVFMQDTIRRPAAGGTSTRSLGPILYPHGCLHDESVAGWVRYWGSREDFSAFVPAGGTCTVTFSAYPGTVSEQSREVAPGQPLGTLPVPVPPPGRRFLGWFDGGEVTAETICTGDMLLRAGYSPRVGLWLSRNGTVKAIGDLWTTENGAARPVMDLWSVDGGVPRQGS